MPTKDSTKDRYPASGGAIYLGRDLDFQKGTIRFLMRMHNHFMAIECSLRFKICPAPSEYEPEANIRFWKKLNDEIVDYGLPKVQSILSNLIFGETNYAYVVDRQDGKRQIVQRQKRLSIDYIYASKKTKAPEYPLWLPVVKDIGELDFIDFVDDRRFLAKWNGVLVEVIYGWSIETLLEVDSQTYGRWKLKEHNLEDFTFKGLAHIVIDGQLTGLIYEPVWGRCVRHEDRLLMYEFATVAAKKGAFFVNFFAFYNLTFFICDGVPKFRDLALIEYDHDEEGKRRKLNVVFEFIDRYLSKEALAIDWYERIPSEGIQRRPIIPVLSSPERPLSFSYILPFFNPSFRPWITHNKSRNASIDKDMPVEGKFTGYRRLAPCLSLMREEQSSVNRPRLEFPYPKRDSRKVPIRLLLAPEEG